MTTEKLKDGGPAFPLQQQCSIGTAYQHDHIESGISMRDYFAAKALPVLIASGMETKDSAWPVTVQEIAQKSYQFADAMLSERAK